MCNGIMANVNALSQHPLAKNTKAVADLSTQWFEAYSRLPLTHEGQVLVAFTLNNC